MKKKRSGFLAKSFYGATSSNPRRKWKWALLLALLAAALLCAVWYFFLRPEAEIPFDESIRALVLTSGPENADRNRYLREDIAYLEKQLPRRHKNLYAHLTQKEYKERLASLSRRVPELTNAQVFVELSKVIAALGDGHTNISYWDGYRYPLAFWLFGEDVVIIGTDAAHEGLVGARVTAVNGMPIEDVLGKLSEIISYENESWRMYQLPSALAAPVYLQGLGIIGADRLAELTLTDGTETWTVRVPAYHSAEMPEISVPANDPRIARASTHYEYQLLPEESTLYFRYNTCAEAPDLPFAPFVENMMQQARDAGVERIIVDLRANTGGDSRVFAPFIAALRVWMVDKPETAVRVLVGRATFSSGMFAVYHIKEAAPGAIAIGEPTGGAIDAYGEVQTMTLPRSGLPVYYSTKYFEFSKSFAYKNPGTNTFLPDVPITQSLQGYLAGEDEALAAALAQ